jgi:uncharacterized protein
MIAPVHRSTLALSLLLACAPARAPSDGDLATEALDAACLRGEDTCEQAALRYATLEGVEAATRRSEMLYQSCRQRPVRCDALAQQIAAGVLPAPPRRRVAALYEHVCGTRYPKDEAACMAAALYGRRCDEDHAPSCAAIADLAADGRLDARAEKALATLHGRACDGGHASSCLAAAAVVEAGARARRLSQGCEGASAEACLALGDSHAVGRGVAIDQALARRFRARACELDLGEACHALATMVERGVGGGVDRHRAVELEAKACDLGAPAACEAHGRALEHGTAEKKTPDPAAAYDRYRRAVKGHGEACDKGDLQACARLAVLLEEGSGTSADRDEARSLFTRACAGGEAEACLRLSLRGDRLDLDRLAEHRAALSRACQRGAGEACLVVARLGDETALERGCASGSGPSCTAAAMTRPLVDGRALAERACALADPGGCHLLGTIVELAGDLELALSHHREGCLWGHGAACARTGMLLLRGDVRLEPLAAASSLHRGCELGDWEACFELGILELAGERVALDVPHGKGALERACRAGHAAGCGALGAEMLRGRHLEIDLTAGAALLRRACDDGDDASCLELAEALGGQLPRDAAESRRVLGAAAHRGERRCERALSICHGGGGVLETTWRVEHGRLRRQLSDPPRCGAELERTCNTAREALRRLCADDGSRCWQVAVLERLMASGGLAASLAAAADHEVAAVRWARAACGRGEARGCAVMFHAHDEGRGVKADAREADRFRARACELDPGYCP